MNEHDAMLKFQKVDDCAIEVPIEVTCRKRLKTGGIKGNRCVNKPYSHKKIPFSKFPRKSLSPKDLPVAACK